MKFWGRWLLFWLLMGTALRLALLLAYPEGAVMPHWSDFAAGMANDLQAFFIVAGFVAIAGFARQTWLRAAVFVALAVSLVILIAEIFFWLEFESRLDRLVFHYLAYPKEVLLFLEDQFYLSLFLLPFLLVTWLLVLLLGWPVIDEHWRKLRIGFVFAATLVVLVGQPIGQTNTRIASEFVSNGYLGVLTAARYQIDEVAWLTQPVSTFRAMPVAMPLSSVSQQIRSELGVKRHVIVIVEESFAGPAWRDPEMREKYLPNFLALSKNSLSFTQLFATGSRTTRGMEALLNGFPPLPGISATERDGYEKLPSLARAMGEGGFYPVFLYGGWPQFSNFSNYWRAMGYQYIWTREDFDEPFETSWGVADGALFDRLISEMGELTAQHQRVFLSTLTVSHHRPYDFPDGVVSYPSDERSSDYAMAYADQALGDFFRAARQQPWYEDTLFVVVADHGLHPRGDALIPVNSYRIPMLFHAAGLQPREIDGLGSSVSLPNTLMTLLQIETDEKFFDQDLLCDCDTTVPVEFGYHIGLLARDRLNIVRADGQYAAWDYDLEQNTLHPNGQRDNPAARQRIIDVFAPAYQRFYDLPMAELPNAYNAEIVGQ